jgi:two-component system response regulator AtoC
VRVLATTTRPLSQLVERGAFDAELLKIVSGATVEVPPLRARPEDLLSLVESFAREAGARAPLRISAGAVARLRSYPWPSNVIELRNAIERAVVLAAEGDIMAEHLPHDPLPIAATRGGLRDHVDSVERDAIVKALAECNQNQTHAAKRLGLSRRALIYKMEKYALKAPPKTVVRATA